MEKELLTLLDDFNSGKLRAFGKQSILAIQQLIYLHPDFCSKWNTLVIYIV